MPILSKLFVLLYYVFYSSIVHCLSFVKQSNFGVIPIGKLDRVLVNHISDMLCYNNPASILKFIYSLFIKFNSFGYDTPSGGMEASKKQIQI
jgi:hypothetical protein